MNMVQILGLIRDLLKISGSTMLVSDSEINTIIGAVVTLGTVAWSIYERVKKTQSEKDK